MRKMRRFKNKNHKIKVICEIIGSLGECSLRDICEELERKGYRVNRHALGLFIRNEMANKYIKRKKRRSDGTFRYSL